MKGTVQVFYCNGSTASDDTPEAANCIMDDDLQGAEDGLAHGPDPNSSFHKVHCPPMPAYP